MKTFYPIQLIDLRFQIDYITPKKIKLFEEYENAPENTKLCVILIKHREIKMVSDGNKITGIELIYMKVLNFKNLMKKYILEKDTMNESQLQKIYNYPI